MAAESSTSSMRLSANLRARQAIEHAITSETFPETKTTVYAAALVDRFGIEFSRERVGKTLAEMSNDEYCTLIGPRQSARGNSYTKYEVRR